MDYVIVTRWILLVCFLCLGNCSDSNSSINHSISFSNNDENDELKTLDYSKDETFDIFKKLGEPIKQKKKSTEFRNSIDFGKSSTENIMDLHTSVNNISQEFKKLTMEETKSDSVKNLIQLTDELNGKQHTEERWGIGLTWPEVLKAEISNRQLDKTFSIVRIFAKKYLKLIRQSLIGEAEKGILTLDDYKNLIRAGYSDFVVKIAISHDKTIMLNLLELIQHASFYGEEAFINHVIKKRHKLTGFEKIAAEPEFWAYICFLTTLKAFDVGKYYLSSENAKILSSQLEIELENCKEEGTKHLIERCIADMGKWRSK